MKSPVIFRLSLMSVAVLAMVLLTAQVVGAHERRAVGAYELVVGFS